MSFHKMRICNASKVDYVGDQKLQQVDNLKTVMMKKVERQICMMRPFDAVQHRACKGEGMVEEENVAHRSDSWRIHISNLHSSYLGSLKGTYP